MIPTFNCAHFLKETLVSVLAQDPGPEQMEIIVVDDHSTKDDPEAIVKSHGNGRTQFIKQSKNVGKARNYATGIAQSKGHYIHLLHGDDTVSPRFYRAMETLFANNKEASASFCRCDYINAHNEKIGETVLLSEKAGILDDFLEQIAVWQLLQPPSIVFKREVYENLGTYDERLKYMEDWEFYVRAATRFQFAYTPEALAQYRIFPENSSSQSAKGGKRLATLKQVLHFMDGYLPKEIKERIYPKRRQAVALYVLNYIPQCRAQNDFLGLWRYSLVFFRYNQQPRLCGRWLRFLFQFKKI